MNSPFWSLGASKDHINKLTQTKNGEEYSDLKGRTKKVADKIL
jgi:hypothetical protein